MRRSCPELWIEPANCFWRSLRFCSLFSISKVERMSKLFSGVRSSWDILAKNSDLYLLEFSRSCALNSSWRLTSSRSRFFALKFNCCSSSAWACCSSSSLLLLNSSCWSCSSSDCCCVFSRRSWSLSRDCAALSAMPMFSASLRVRSIKSSVITLNEPSSRTAKLCSWNRIGMNSRDWGFASPRPDLIFQ